MDNKKAEKETNYLTFGICFGIALGLSICQLAFNNSLGGLGVGIILGAVAGELLNKKYNSKSKS